MAPTRDLQGEVHGWLQSAHSHPQWTGATVYCALAILLADVAAERLRRRRRPATLRIVKPRTRPTSELDFNSRETIARFRKAAEAFNHRATKSKAAARKVLVEEGIYTKNGKLTKQYS